MLATGGQLLTITPNWHVRPSDVTVAFCPPRTASAGLHLKEYTLGEVRDLLRRAGFRPIVDAAGRNSRSHDFLRQRGLEWQVPVRARFGMAAVRSGAAAEPRHGPELHDCDEGVTTAHPWNFLPQLPPSACWSGAG